MKKDALAVRKKQGLTKRASGRKWDKVAFMHAVKNIRQSGLPGTPAMRQVVIGRALGDRKDGQCFFVEMDIPWLLPAKWDWKRHARTRLDSYLDERCSCEARGSEVKICEFHQELTAEWKDLDDAMEKASRDVANTANLSQRLPGAIMPLRILKFDFPWVREDTVNNRIVCEICGFHEEPFPTNSTWQNVFVRKHSECGFPAHDYVKSMNECNIMYYTDGERAIDGMIEEKARQYADLVEMLGFCRGRGTDLLPEKMRPEEFVKFLREKMAKVTA